MSDPVDQYPEITEACKPSCAAQFSNYEACIGRLAGKKEGDCEPWYFDYLKCLDKCRVPQVKKYTK